MFRELSDALITIFARWRRRTRPYDAARSRTAIAALQRPGVGSHAAVGSSISGHASATGCSSATCAAAAARSAAAACAAAATRDA